MKLPYAPGSCLLVERVDVLGNHPAEQRLLFEDRQEAMGKGGPDMAGGCHELASELVEQLGMLLKMGDAEYQLRVVLPGFVKSPGAAKIGDSSLGRDTGAGQRHSRGRRADQFRAISRFDSLRKGRHENLRS